jgi:carboxyl-terminal processing protease
MTLRGNARRRHAGFAAAVGAVGLATGVSLVFIAVSKGGAQADDPYRQLARFGAVLALVQDKYVDRPVEAKLIEAALRAMVGSLDPHSGYVSGQDYRALQSIGRGEFGDVGLGIVERDKVPTVSSVMDGTSAAKAGILPGDRIEAIGDETTERLTIDQAVEKMRGAKNTFVRLTIGRGRGGTVKDFEILRDYVKTKSVEFHVESGDVGYIRIPQFLDATAGELKNAMATLRAEVPSEAFKGYVLDLRNDPGGLVNQAVLTVNAFIDGGTILSTRGRAPGANQIFTARPAEDQSQGKPLVVLVNGGTASAAEIVAGALQDLKRATLIGTRTFGKGSMQTTIPVGDGALVFTTALYFTPSGRSIQARGIDPDIEISERVPAGADAPSEDVGEASLRGHLSNAGGDRPGSQAYIPANPLDDRQLTAAIDFLHSLESAAR